MATLTFVPDTTFESLSKAVSALPPNRAEKVLQNLRAVTARLETEKNFRETLGTVLWGSCKPPLPIVIYHDLLPEESYIPVLSELDRHLGIHFCHSQQYKAISLWCEEKDREQAYKYSGFPGTTLIHVSNDGKRIEKKITIVQPLQEPFPIMERDSTFMPRTAVATAEAALSEEHKS